MNNLSICGLFLATSFLLAPESHAQTLVLDDFSAGFGGIPFNPVTVDGAPTVFDELTDIAPGGAIGDRHEWIRGFNFKYAGIANNLSVTDSAPGPLQEVLNFGGFDYNLEFGLDYTPSAGAPSFDLTAGGGDAFAMDVVFSDIPSAPMTIEVVTGTGTGTMSVTVLLDNLDFTPTNYVFDFSSFTGTPDFSDVQKISWSFLTVNEFGPDAIFDNFEVIATPPISLTLPALVGGTIAQLQVSGATPSTPIFYVYSAVGTGSQYLPILDVTLGLANPFLGGVTMTDSSGNGALPQYIPQGLAGFQVYVQAIQYQMVSNVATAAIQ